MYIGTRKFDSSQLAHRIPNRSDRVITQILKALQKSDCCFLFWRKMFFSEIYFMIMYTKQTLVRSLKHYPPLPYEKEFIEHLSINNVLFLNTAFLCHFK